MLHSFRGILNPQIPWNYFLRNLWFYELLATKFLEIIWLLIRNTRSILFLSIYESNRACNSVTYLYYNQILLLGRRKLSTQLIKMFHLNLYKLYYKKTSFQSIILFFANIFRTTINLRKSSYLFKEIIFPLDSQIIELLLRFLCLLQESQKLSNICETNT